MASLFKNKKVINSSLGLDMIAQLKENIIVYGSTRTGKTEILKTVFNDTISSAIFRIFASEYYAINLTKPTPNERPYVLTKKDDLNLFFKIIFFELSCSYNNRNYL